MDTETSAEVKKLSWRVEHLGFQSQAEKGIRSKSYTPSDDYSNS